PAQTVKSGETHKVIDLIERMIKFSDNNAAYALINNIDRAKIDQTSKDLKVAYPRQEVIDYITVNDFSYFLRVLYNATYLRSDLSERALELLGGIDFKDGLVAGVPSGITVAHKFGLQTGYNSVGIVEKRELHDCGIIYNEKSPYVLCIMTKSGDSFEGAKSTIKSISALVWEEVSKGQ
ncbi:MAG: Beta-lactamase class A-like protein, partial [candidate division CPR2 bacterium GW2011_GWC2_39_10]